MWPRRPAASVCTWAPGEGSSIPSISISRYTSSADGVGMQQPTVLPLLPLEGGVQCEWYTLRHGRNSGRAQGISATHSSKVWQGSSPGGWYNGGNGARARRRRRKGGALQMMCPQEGAGLGALTVARADRQLCAMHRTRYRRAAEGAGSEAAAAAGPEAGAEAGLVGSRILKKARVFWRGPLAWDACGPCTELQPNPLLVIRRAIQTQRSCGAAGISRTVEDGTWTAAATVGRRHSCCHVSCSGRDSDVQWSAAADARASARRSTVLWRAVHQKQQRAVVHVCDSDWRAAASCQHPPPAGPDRRRLRKNLLPHAVRRNGRSAAAQRSAAGGEVASTPPPDFPRHPSLPHISSTHWAHPQRRRTCAAPPAGLPHRTALTLPLFA